MRWRSGNDRDSGGPRPAAVASSRAHRDGELVDTWACPELLSSMLVRSGAGRLLLPELWGCSIRKHPEQDDDDNGPLRPLRSGL